MNKGIHENKYNTSKFLPLGKVKLGGGGDDLPCVFVLFLYSLSNPFGRGLDRNHLLELQSENKYSDNVS